MAKDNSGETQGVVTGPTKPKVPTEPIIVDGKTLFVASGKPCDRYILADDLSAAEGIAKLSMDSVGKVGLCTKRPVRSTPAFLQVPPVEYPDKSNCSSKDREKAQLQGGLNYEKTSL